MRLGVVGWLTVTDFYEPPYADLRLTGWSQQQRSLASRTRPRRGRTASAGARHKDTSRGRGRRGPAASSHRQAGQRGGARPAPGCHCWPPAHAGTGSTSPTNCWSTSSTSSTVTVVGVPAACRHRRRLFLLTRTSPRRCTRSPSPPRRPARPGAVRHRGSRREQRRPLAARREADTAPRLKDSSRCSAWPDGARRFHGTPAILDHLTASHSGRNCCARRRWIKVASSRARTPRTVCASRSRPDLALEVAGQQQRRQPRLLARLRRPGRRRGSTRAPLRTPRGAAERSPRLTVDRASTASAAPAHAARLDQGERRRPRRGRRRWTRSGETVADVEQHPDRLDTPRRQPARRRPRPSGSLRRSSRDGNRTSPGRAARPRRCRPHDDRHC